MSRTKNKKHSDMWSLTCVLYGLVLVRKCLWRFAVPTRHGLPTLPSDTQGPTVFVYAVVLDSIFSGWGCAMYDVVPSRNMSRPHRSLLPIAFHSLLRGGPRRSRAFFGPAVFICLVYWFNDWLIDWLVDWLIFTLKPYRPASWSPNPLVVRSKTGKVESQRWDI